MFQWFFFFVSYNIQNLLSLSVGFGNYTIQMKEPSMKITSITYNLFAWNLMLMGDLRFMGGIMSIIEIPELERN